MNVDHARMLPRPTHPIRMNPRGLHMIQVPSFNSSITEGIWSHGSSYEQFVAREDLVLKGDYKSQDRLKPESPEYRCENGGIVVYDVRAQVYGDTSFVQTDTPSDLSRAIPPRKRSLDFAPESDKRRYAAMKSYPPYPSFPIDSLLLIPPDSLRFNSRFESGNLKRAIRMMEDEYSLLLQEDTNTEGHTQWYYFAVCNSSATTYKFSIGNLYKNDSLYADGMLPTVFSVKKLQKEGIAWHHAGCKVSYFENSSDFSHPNRTFSLTFTYKFDYENDTVYFAHSVPYTYEDLCKWLEQVKTTHSNIARVNSMCQTLAGNVCEMVTITEDIGTYKAFESEAMEWHMSIPARKMLRTKSEASYQHHQSKKGIVLTARVHPGETVGSHMLRGAVDFLLSDSPTAIALRKHFVFRIVPMLNPDGVRYGNYRCSVLGVDLNRRWLNPSKTLHPTVFYTKRMMQVFAEEHQMAFFCDFHGHSCKRNVFMYGCSRPCTTFENRKSNVEAKVLPLLLAHSNPLVSWKDCHFRMEKSKEATARSVVCTEFNIMQSYTIEASFFGPSDVKAFCDPARTDAHMMIPDYERIGASLLETSLIFSSDSLYIEALSQVKDLLRALKFPSLLESDPISPTSAVPSKAIPQIDPDEDDKKLWEMLVELDTVEDEYEPSGESDSESGGESEKSDKARSKKQSRKQSRASPRVEGKISTEALQKDVCDSGSMRQVPFHSKTIRSERCTPSKSPLVGTFRERRKTAKRRIGSPLLRSRRIEDYIEDVTVTEPSSATNVSLNHKPLEVRGHTRFHKSQMRVKRSLTRPKSLKKPHGNESEKCNMIETMRKALRRGAMKPLICSPISPVLGNFVIENTRMSIKRLKTSYKSKTPEM